MFNRVVDWAVQNRLLVLIALAVLITTAAFQIPKLNLDAFPDVTNAVSYTHLTLPTNREV